jgi:ergothioneine biosynthesis protein EgtB
MLQENYIQIRNKTEKICSLLKDEDHIVQVSEFASPPKWHLGHTTWFFETFILKNCFPEYRPFNPEFDFLFNSYYHSMGDRIERNKRGLLFRPYTSEVYAYRKYVDEHIKKYLSSFTAEMNEMLELGLNHEQQHQELLLTDTKYLFSQHSGLPIWDKSKTLQHLQLSSSFNWLPVKEGVYDIGYNGNGFCFDNELPVHKQYIQAFEIMDRPVTNREYLEFIADGGYQNFKYWLAEGWDWIVKNNIQQPMYWHKNKKDYFFYHQDGLKELDPLLPLMHISYYEAEAYAHWKGWSLPTEFEWETAARTYPIYFKNMVWEWTQSAYLPYPGYTIAPGAIGEYNGKFMVNQMVLRGGSIATPVGHSRETYRNFFHANMQWQFSGIRLIKRNKNQL